MSNSFNIGDIVRLAQTMLDAKTKGREFMLEDVHKLTRLAYEQYPNDSVITQVASAIEKMAERAPSGAVISQSDISNIYNNFVKISSDSRFREVLGGLLLNESAVAKTDSDFVKQNRLDVDIEKAIDNQIDPNLTSTIASIFSDSIDSSKAFDNKIATKGIEFVSAELKSLGFKPSVEIMGGHQDNIIYAAHFDTRKGRITVAIPTQINNGRVLFPSTFVADDHLEELNATALTMFVEKKALAGNFSVPKTSDVLSAVRVIFGKKDMENNEFSKISNVIPDSTEKEISPMYSVSDKVPGEVDELDASQISMPNLTLSYATQKADMPLALAHLSRDFEDDVLEAASAFGLESIRNGKELIASELRSAGFKNAQVRFGSESNQSVIYLASINTPKGATEIEVAVEMRAVGSNKYMPLMPTYFAYDGLIEDFTPAKLQRFAISSTNPSSKTTVYSASYSYMLLPELKDEILKAASENDYVTCETILSEIKERFDEDNFKNAIADYHFVLTQKSKLNKQSQHKCSKVIHAGHGSIEERCGHFLVPMSKVVTDEQGNCRLKTAIERERLNPLEKTGAEISTSKINLT